MLNVNAAILLLWFNQYPQSFDYVVISQAKLRKCKQLDVPPRLNKTQMLNPRRTKVKNKVRS